MANAKPTIGFLGLGAMGCHMAQHLQRVGYTVLAFDPQPDRLEASTATGCIAAGSEAAVVDQAEIVMTSLPSSTVLVRVAKAHLIPLLRRGQLVIDLGTTGVAQTRQFAATLAAKGADWVDAPVSGGPGGAERADLRIFVGGTPEGVARSLPILRVLGASERVVVCGPAGSGQLVKGANQLAMGLGAAAYLEALFYAVQGGVDPQVIMQAVGGTEPWRQHFAAVAGQVIQGRSERVDAKLPELPLFLAEAHAQGFSIPLTEALHGFCEGGDQIGRAHV